MCVNCGNTSCNECNSVISKRGLPGPQGPRGFTGPQGPQGASGTILPEDVVNGIEGANDPSSSNPFATTSDLGGYIPIPGTGVNNPVTGPIEFKINTFLFWIDSLGNINRTAFRDGFFRVTKADPSNATISDVKINTSNGVESDYYFGANTDNTYVQKKYVDTAVVPLDYGDIVFAGGIENTQVFTTGAGTGIASVDLSPIMAIGKDVTVSDLANNASTHNIQIDAGAGNTILYNGATSQDITLNTNGASVTIRKITATKFMVI